MLSMSTVLERTALTTADLLAMPDDGFERWLIRGQLREHRDASMAKRNRWHSQILISVGALLKTWRDRQPEPRGQVLGGEAGCILQRDPDTTVGIDVAYFGPEIAAQETDETTLMGGPPVLAVEILSPSDTQQDIDEKVDAYLDAEVKLVWIIDPHKQTVLVLRPDAPPRLFNVTETIDAEPHLPGFSAAVATMFE
jgi:Uma2 family endonuclease